MKTYARNINGKAVDVTTENPSRIFHHGVASTFIEVPEGTVNGADFLDGKWVNPLPQQDSEIQAVAEYASMTPIRLYSSFTTAERASMKSYDDARVSEFFDFMKMNVEAQKTDNGLMINPNLNSFGDDLAHLLEVGVLSDSTRIEQIKNGELQ